MADRTIITPELCRQLLRYDPENGYLYWRYRPRSFFPTQRAYLIWNGRFPDKRAFISRDRRGYFCGALLYRPLFLHRVAWAIVHGEWPDQIDHINGDRGDNRLVNIRSVSAKENARNKGRYKNSISEVPGVHEGTPGIWHARIAHIRLGTYLTRAEAIAARKAAEKVLGYHPNNGRVE